MLQKALPVCALFDARYVVTEAIVAFYEKRSLVINPLTLHDIAWIRSDLKSVAPYKFFGDPIAGSTGQSFVQGNFEWTLSLYLMTTSIQLLSDVSA